MISIGLSESLRIKNFLAVFRAEEMSISGNRRGQVLEIFHSSALCYVLLYGSISLRAWNKVAC